MKFKVVIHLVSFLMMVMSFFMIITSAVSFIMNDQPEAWKGMLISCAITMVLAAIMWATTRTKIELSRREGIGIVVFGWFIAGMVGGLPFLLTGSMNNYYDAFFESISGLTTTGASVMTDLELHSRAILLWRAMLHFFGGMGILVLVVAIIPFLGVGGMQIYRAEVTGPSKDRLTPRIASTAKLLWGIYILMNIVLVVLLKFGGMNWFDSVCHAMAAISTGGFSTRTAGIAAYDSLYIELTLVAGMLLSGINFGLHFRALRGEPLCYFKDSECRFYLGIWMLAIVLIAVELGLKEVYGAAESLRHSLFYVTSILTCTGFATVDYNHWPVFSKMVLIIIFFMGGCAGSTAGGIKQIRVMVLFKKMTRDLKSFLKPQAIYPVKIGQEQVTMDIVFNIVVFFFIYLLTVAIATLLMCLYTDDLMTAFSAVLTCIGNVGPGFSTVGPVNNFEHLPDPAIFILSNVMLAGRLEFYTVLVVLLPSFWRK